MAVSPNSHPMEAPASQGIKRPRSQDGQEEGETARFNAPTFSAPHADVAASGTHSQAPTITGPPRANSPAELNATTSMQNNVNANIAAAPGQQSTPAQQAPSPLLTARIHDHRLAFACNWGTAFHRLATPPVAWQGLEVYIEMVNDGQRLPQTTLVAPIQASRLVPYGGQLIRLPEPSQLWHLRFNPPPPRPVTVPTIFRKSAWYAGPSPPPTASVTSTISTAGSASQPHDTAVTAGQHLNKDWICIYPRDDPNKARDLVVDDYTLALPSAFSESERREALRKLAGKGSIGLPCVVNNGVITIDVYGRSFHLSQEHLSPRAMPDSQSQATTTLLKFRLCYDSTRQPKAATPSTSYILNTYHVVFDQHLPDGTSHRYHYEPLAAHIVDDDWASLFFVLADLTTVDTNHRIPYATPVADAAPGRLLTAIAVRLRHGGSRFPLCPTYDGWTELVLPGDACVRELIEQLGVKPALAPDGNIRIKLNIPATILPQDIIFCSNDTKVGAFKRLRYVVRPRMDVRPIRSTQWQFLYPDELGVEAWVVAFFVNLIRRSRGCEAKKLMQTKDVEMKAPRF